MRSPSFVFSTERTTWNTSSNRSLPSLPMKPGEPEKLNVQSRREACGDHGESGGVRAMIITRVALTFGTMVLIAAGVTFAQDRAPGTPPDADQAAVRTGGALFRERCAECHGSDAKGVTGHDLTRLWTSGATDERVFQTIRAGVPNTIMPSSSAPDDELRAVVSYLRSLNDAAIAGPATPE